MEEQGRRPQLDLRKAPPRGQQEVNWQRLDTEAHISDLQLFFPPSVTHCEPDSTYFQPRKWGNSSKTLACLHKSRHAEYRERWDTKKKGNTVLYFLPFQTLDSLCLLSESNSFLILSPWAAVTVAGERDVEVCLICYDSVFNFLTLKIAQSLC